MEKVYKYLLRSHRSHIEEHDHCISMDNNSPQEEQDTSEPSSKVQQETPAERANRIASQDGPRYGETLEWMAIRRDAMRRREQERRPRQPDTPPRTPGREDGTSARTREKTPPRTMHVIPMRRRTSPVIATSTRRRGSPVEPARSVLLPTPPPTSSRQRIAHKPHTASHTATRRRNDKYEDSDDEYEPEDAEVRVARARSLNQRHDSTHPRVSDGTTAGTSGVLGLPWTDVSKMRPSTMDWLAKSFRDRMREQRVNPDHIANLGELNRIFTMESAKVRKAKSELVKSLVDYNDRVRRLDENTLAADKAKWEYDRETIWESMRRFGRKEDGTRFNPGRSERMAFERLARGTNTDSDSSSSSSSESESDDDHTSKRRKH